MSENAVSPVQRFFMQASPDDIRHPPRASCSSRRVAVVVLAHAAVLGALVRMSVSPAPAGVMPHVQLVAVPTSAPVAAVTAPSHAVPVHAPPAPPVPAAAVTTAALADPAPAAPATVAVPGLSSPASAGGASDAPGPSAPSPLRTGPAFLRQPAPVYPEDLRQSGVEGSVVLFVHVDAAGRPQNVSVERSSGYAQFDRSALEAVRRDYLFRPAREGDRPVESDVRFTVPFRLHD